MAISYIQSCTTTQVGDLRQVLNCVDQEITTLCRRLSGVTVRFERDSMIQDISVMALREVISSIHLQFYRDGEVVREHSYHIVENQLESWGPPPDQPPLGGIPPGCTVRVVVHSNPRLPVEVCDEWFVRLGWSTSETLIMPEGEPTPYGTFVSGGFGVERRLLVNPRFEVNSRAAGKEKAI